MVKISADWTNPDAIRETPFVFTSGTQVDVTYVKSIHAFNQLIGYIKYINRNDSNVYFRGQTKLYPTMTASIFRNSVSGSSIGTRNTAIVKYITDCSTKVDLIRGIPEYTREPLLQHYGLKTRWIDLVDNVWIAMWFGLHEYKSGYLDRYYEFVCQRTDNDFLYIFLMANDAFIEKDNCPGLYVGSHTSVIDLRVSTPSIFLRPHSQHALLMKPKINDTCSDIDLSKYIVHIIKIRVNDAYDWIGKGRLMTAENIYPSPLFDQGYGILLEQAPHSKNHAKNFGTITNITYSVPKCC